MNSNKNQFVRSVMVLTTGTVLAQVISYLITPILTRIYTAEEMGDLGVYMRAIGFISTLATARYELSLPLPKNDSHSFLLFRLSFRISIYTLIGCSLIGILYLSMRPFKIDEILAIALTILGSFFLVIINLGTNWAIRHKQFKRISLSRMSNSLVTNSLKWVFGLLNVGSIGLLFATFTGFLFSSITFIRDLLKTHKRERRFLSQKKMFVLGREYRQFPFVSLPHSMLDLGRDLLVAMLIITYFNKEVFGSFNHSYTILRLPLLVIGTSVGQVFFNRCSEYIREGKEIYHLVKRIVLTLFFISIIPFSIIYFFGEPLFGFIFGSTWRESGYYSELMAVWLMFNFISSTISNLPMVLKRQKEFFILGIIYSGLQLLCFGLFPLLWGNEKNDFRFILSVGSWVFAFYQVTVIFMSLFFAKKGLKAVS